MVNNLYNKTKLKFKRRVQLTNSKLNPTRYPSYQ